MDDLPDTVAENRARQREIYGEALGDRVRRLTTELGITQARLAATLGLSPAMLSQLSGAKRVKIGDPAVLGRMSALDRRVARGPVPAESVEDLLERVRTGATPWGPDGGCCCGAFADGAPSPTGPGHEGAGVPVTPGEPGAGPAAGRVPRPRRPPAPAPTADDALRGISAPARLVAAAAELAPSFPEIAEVLRRAAGRR